MTKNNTFLCNIIRRPCRLNILILKIIFFQAFSISKMMDWRIIKLICFKVICEKSSLVQSIIFSDFHLIHWEQKLTTRDKYQPKKSKKNKASTYNSESWKVWKVPFIIYFELYIKKLISFFFYCCTSVTVLIKRK